MDYVEILFNNIPIRFANKWVNDIFLLNDKQIISSHFYVDGLGDFEFSTKINFCNYCSTNGTCNVFLKSLTLDKMYNEVLIIISSDGETIDILISFSCDQLDLESLDSLKTFLKNIFDCNELSDISVSYEHTPEEPLIVIMENR